MLCAPGLKHICLNRLPTSGDRISVFVLLKSQDSQNVLPSHIMLSEAAAFFAVTGFKVDHNVIYVILFRLGASVDASHSISLIMMARVAQSEDKSAQGIVVEVERVIRFAFDRIVKPVESVQNSVDCMIQVPDCLGRVN